MESLQSANAALVAQLLALCTPQTALHLDLPTSELLRWAAARRAVALTAGAELPLPAREDLVVVVSLQQTALAMLETLLAALPRLKQVRLVPLAPDVLPQDIVERCEAWMARVSVVASDDKDWKGVSVVELAQRSSLACALTHRMAILPALAIGSDPGVLRQFLLSLGRRWHCYALGDKSAKTAKALCHSGAGEEASRSPNLDVSVVLVDRACDLVQVLRHGSKTVGHVLGKSTPRWTAASSDIRIPLDNVLPQVPDNYRPCGSLSNAADAGWGRTLHDCLAASGKEAAGKVSALLKAAAPLKTAEDIEAAARSWWNLHPNAESAPLLSLSCAVAHALRLLSAPEWQEAVASESLILSPAAEDAEIISQLIDLIALKPDDAKGPKQPPARVLRLALLLYCFQSPHALRGEAAVASRQQLARVLAHAFAARQAAPQPVADTAKTIDALLAAAQEQQFRARAGLRTFASLSSRDGFYAPLLPRILDQILLKEAPLSDDWRLETTEPQSMAASALSLFGGVLGPATKRRPTDGQLLLLYLEGGCTFEELGYVEDAVQKFRPGLPVVVASPKLMDDAGALRVLGVEGGEEFLV